jgi:hypothetical protein
MNPTLDQMDRHFPASGRKVLSLCVPGLLAVTALTAMASLPAAARTPKIKKPGAPTAVIATAISGGAAVSWTAPVSDGGSPITGYTVTASHGGETCTTTGATMCTVTGLTNGRRYEIKVQASNIKGEGHASTRIQVTPLPTVSFLSESSGFFSETSITVPVTLSQSISRTVQVDFTTSSPPGVGNFEEWWIGDAAAFTPNSGTVTFAPGQTSAVISFTVITPNPGGCPVGIPANECFPGLGVTLSSPANALLGPAPVTYLAYGLDSD